MISKIQEAWSEIIRPADSIVNRKFHQWQENIPSLIVMLRLDMQRCLNYNIDAFYLSISSRVESSGHAQLIAYLVH